MTARRRCGCGERERPDVCLLDVTMAGMDGFETLRRIRAISPAARVLMLTSSDSAEDMEQAVEAGAQGYLTKNVVYDELVAAIRDAHAGGRPIAKKLQRTVGGESNAGLLTPTGTRGFGPAAAGIHQR
jgi:DNA-binding NarL/FixJ family response regulator